jgi:arylsulfatase A-like enzyme
VPLLMMGRRWIRPGEVAQYTEVVDIAPTLADILRVRRPSGAEGRVLSEALR